MSKAIKKTMEAGKSLSFKNVEKRLPELAIKYRKSVFALLDILRGGGGR